MQRKSPYRSRAKKNVINVDFCTFDARLFRVGIQDLRDDHLCSLQAVCDLVTFDFYIPLNVATELRHSPFANVSGIARRAIVELIERSISVNEVTIRRRDYNPFLRAIDNEAHQGIGIINMFDYIGTDNEVGLRKASVVERSR
jgi:hypothetical protein